MAFFFIFAIQNHLMKNSNEHTIRELLQTFVNKAGKQKLYAEQTILGRWPEYIGEYCASQTKAVSLHNGILKVRVLQAALRFELTSRKSLIIERINNDYAMPVVKDILFL